MLSIWRWGSSIRAHLASVTTKISARSIFLCSLCIKIWRSNLAATTESSNDHEKLDEAWSQATAFRRFVFPAGDNIPRPDNHCQSALTLDLDLSLKELSDCYIHLTDLKIEKFVLPPKRVFIPLNHAEGCSAHNRRGESCCVYPHLTGIFGLSTFCRAYSSSALFQSVST